MRRKESWITLLVCLNLVLLTGLIFASSGPPAAYAQTPPAAGGTGLAGNYLAVCGEIQDEYDALYMLDTRTRQLHAFYFDKTNKRLVYGGSRDLERDFRNNKE
jgi:hypothetical protein